jgi:uncharacterized membrane protein (DUF2068 family)
MRRRAEAEIALAARGRDRGDPALRWIVGYKLVKAAAEIVIGLLLLLGSAQVIHELRELAASVRAHATAAWSIALAEWLVRAETGRNLAIVGAASLFDGAFSLVEGWALHRGFRWGRWLVIVATSGLLPFELVALLRHVTVGRLALLLANVLIVLVLLRRRARTG